MEPTSWKVLVTGAGGDIGRATALAFAAAGATVACTDANAATLARTLELLAGRGHGRPADLGDTERLPDLLDWAEAAVGGPLGASPSSPPCCADRPWPR